MKKQASLLLALVAVVGLTVSANAASNIALSLVDQSSSTNSTVSVGNLITYNINIANLLTYPNGGIGSYDITVDFPSAVLSFQSYTLGSGFDVNDSPFQTSSTGVVEIGNISFDTPENILAAQSSSFTIGTITFQAISNGTGALTFDSSVTSLSPETGIGSYTYSTSSAQITAVPEPSSVALMVAGAGALAFVALRRRSQAGV